MVTVTPIRIQVLKVKVAVDVVVWHCCFKNSSTAQMEVASFTLILDSKPVKQLRLAAF